MPALRNNVIYILCAIFPLLFWGRPSFSETAFSEKTLPADTLVEEQFEAGTGLPVGKIQSVRGEVVVFHRDLTIGRRAKTGLPLYQGDMISTRSNGRILCRLIDGSKFLLTSDTTLTILQCSNSSARKTSVSFLSLKQGSGRFQVKSLAELSSNEFKTQTETAFILAKDADFIVKANLHATEIITFDQSRLEVTSLADPEGIFFLTDFQRTVVDGQLGPATVETVSQEEAEAVMAEFRLSPQSKLYASSPEKYREEDTAAEALKSASNAEEY